MAPKEKVIIHCMDCEQDGLFEMWTDINAKNDKVQKKKAFIRQAITIHLSILPLHALCGPSYAVPLSGSRAYDPVRHDGP